MMGNGSKIYIPLQVVRDKKTQEERDRRKGKTKKIRDSKNYASVCDSKIMSVVFEIVRVRM
jgi:hypothetical protein